MHGQGGSIPALSATSPEHQKGSHQKGSERGIEEPRQDAATIKNWQPTSYLPLEKGAIEKEAGREMYHPLLALPHILR